MASTTSPQTKQKYLNLLTELYKMKTVHHPEALCKRFKTNAFLVHVLKKTGVLKQSTPKRGTPWVWNESKPPDLSMVDILMGYISDMSRQNHLKRTSYPVVQSRKQQPVLTVNTELPPAHIGEPKQAKTASIPSPDLADTMATLAEVAVRLGKKDIAGFIRTCIKTEE